MAEITRERVKGARGRRWALAGGAGVLAAAALVMAWRVDRLSDAEPRIDQAYFAVWVQDVGRADHLWPRRAPGGSFKAALERDRGSAVHHVLRRVYLQPFRVFNLASLASVGALVPLFGDDYRHLVRISILSSIVSALLLGTLALGLGRLDSAAHPVTYPLTALFAAVLALGSFYLDLFSPQGPHNIGLAWMLVHAVATLWLVARLSRVGAAGPVAWAACLSTLAAMLYAYYLLPWLIVPALLAQFLLRRAVPRRALFLYAGTCIVALAPVVIAARVLSPEGAANVQQMSMLGSAGTVERAGQWFLQGAALLSAPGLAVALAGVILLARRGLTFGAAFLICHFVLWSGAAGVGTVARHRAIVYALPFLLLGLAHALATAVELATRRRGVPALVLVLLAAAGAGGYALRQGVAFGSPAAACRYVPSYCSTYVEGERLRRIVESVDARLPRGATLCPGGYPLQDLYRVLSARSDVIVLPPLETMAERQAERRLTEYAAERGVRASSPEDLWLLAARGDGIDSKRMARAVFGPEGLAWFTETPEVEWISSWDTHAEGYGAIAFGMLRRPAPS